MISKQSLTLLPASYGPVQISQYFKMISPLFFVHLGRANAIKQVLLSQVLLYHYPENFIVKLLLLSIEESAVNVGIVHQRFDGSSTYEVIYIVLQEILISVELFDSQLCTCVLLYNARFLE